MRPVATSATASNTAIRRSGRAAPDSGPGSPAGSDLGRPRLAVGSVTDAMTGSGADGQLPVHQRGMDRALELVGPGLERRDVVRLLSRSLEVLAIEGLPTGRVQDIDVVGGSRILVVEQDRERLV